MITYKNYTPADESAVIHMSGEWAHEGSVIGLAPDTAEDLRGFPPEYFFLAMEGGEAVGFVKCLVETGSEFCVFPRGGSYLEVSDLYVRPEYRHRGIGARLLRLVEERAAANGIANLSLSSASKDSEAIRRFYTKAGYSVWATQFYKRLGWQVQVFPLETFRHYRFTVIFARYGGGWLYARQKGRDTWETPGGHIEPGETPLECARRELREETGAAQFSIRPAFDYSVHTETEFSYGQVFVAEVETLGALPQESEMEEARVFAATPERMTYPQILPVLYAALKKRPG